MDRLSKLETIPSLRPDSRCGISILFSTHNGERTLPILIDALTKLNQPGVPWEIIAVDNASTDATPAILREAARHLPLTVLLSPRPGKHEALKVGAKCIAGDLVLFTDDDVKPSPDWITAYLDAASNNPGSSLFGGPITPMGIEPLSPWFEASANHHEVLFARSRHPGGKVDAIDFLYGPNFLIRRSEIGVLDEIPANLGPAFDRSNNYAMGLDSAIMQVLIHRGARPIFVPEASVQHCVRAYQTDLNYLLARAERHGRGIALRRVALAKHSCLTRFRILLEGALSYSKARFSVPAKPVPAGKDFDRLWDVHWPIGAMKGALMPIAQNSVPLPESGNSGIVFPKSDESMQAAASGK
jgi:glycosyltransferase involved in cell wall biosynthesis